MDPQQFVVLILFVAVPALMALFVFWSSKKAKAAQASRQAGPDLSHSAKVCSSCGLQDASTADVCSGCEAELT